MLENVVDRTSAGSSTSTRDAKTENTRAGLPARPDRRTWSRRTRRASPRTIVFLTADAFGVLPPIARLTRDQALYYFLSGYTAKVAGTERGVKEPQATFSACFGEPFLPLPPNRIREDAGRQAAGPPSARVAPQHGLDRGPLRSRAPAGDPHTRSMIRAALAGAIADTTLTTDPVFGLLRAGRGPWSPREVLTPERRGPMRKRTTRRRPSSPACSADNFKRYADEVAAGVRDAGAGLARGGIDDGLRFDILRVQLERT